MDEYGQVGPDKNDYEGDLREIAQLLRDRPVHVRLAHRMTQYRLLLVRLDNVYALGGDLGLGTGDDPEDWLYVAVQERGAYTFRLGGYLEAGYVGEKLGLRTQVCGETVAGFLGELGGVLA